MPPAGPMYCPYALSTPQYLPSDMSYHHHSNSYQNSTGTIPPEFPDKLAPLLRSPPTPPPEYRHTSARHQQTQELSVSRPDMANHSSIQSISSAMIDRSDIIQTQMALQKRRDQGLFTQLEPDSALRQPVPSYPTASSVRPVSPPAHNPSTSATDSARRSSTAQIIAPALQIPPAVNGSHGSLAELTAQITCLFWFENMEVLNAAENPSSALSAELTMSKDAVPSTGFRKFVTTMLSTTQVAQNVVILGLLFIYRLKKHSLVKGRLGSEYRLLTVALMLGNKFLDDNTYTNKTWAEVSGISVTEVHIMEVEFLSNMKYNLYCSAAEWTQWQTLLGRFASFVERVTRPAAALPAPVFRPVWNGYSPSPPSSAQLSPIYTNRPQLPNKHGHNLPVIPSLTPQNVVAQSQVQHEPHALAAAAAAGGLVSRKRSLDEGDHYQQSKRVAYQKDGRSQNHQRSNSNASSTGSISAYQHNGQRAQTSMMPTQSQSRPGSTQATPVTRYQLPQLPPIIIPNTGQTVIYPSAPWPQHSMQSNPSQSTMYAAQQQQQSRLQSPYTVSRDGSPLSQLQHTPHSLNTPNRPSTSAIMFQRNSPYRAVREVSTLLVPPPSRALHQPEQVSKDHLHYQPLGRPIEERQTGRLPYVAQNQWLDGQSGLKTATPVEQWPCFFNGPLLAPQQQYHHHHRHQQALGYQGVNGVVSAGRRD